MVKLKDKTMAAQTEAKNQAPSGRSETEKYFVGLVEKALNGDDVRGFFKYIFHAYDRKEWWLEWLGVSEKDIVKNIKDVNASIKE